MPDNPAPPQNIQTLVKKAQDIYENLKNDLEPSQNGKYVAIEVNSGDHFIGETREQAVAEAKKRYPNIVVFVRKIGSIEKVARHSPAFLHKLNYARLF